MGRETKILLALLATLAGVLFGALSMKLLVSRPPAGAGPDVTFDLASAGANELVPPPTLSPPARLPADDLPPLPRAAQVPQQSVPETLPTVSSAEPPVMPEMAEMPEMPGITRQDSFVAPATLQVPLPQPDLPAEQQTQKPQQLASSAMDAAHVATAGDSWWELAERSYGDGRLYRALFAWNRVIDPRVSLAPGTRLEIPPRAKLEAAWPRLMPPP